MPTCPDCATELVVRDGTHWCSNCDRYAMPFHPLDDSQDEVTAGTLTAQKLSTGSYQAFAPGMMTLGLIVPVASRWATFRTHPLTDNFNTILGDWREPEFLGLELNIPGALALFE